MGLYFKNKRSETVQVVFAYHRPGCEGGVNWAKKGWYKILPGNTAKVYTGWVGGSKFFYYAEAVDQSPSWAGPFFTHLPWNAFDWCWNTASNNGRTLGLRKIEISPQFLDYTINLI